MAPYTINEASASNIRQIINAATADTNNAIPGFVAIAVNTAGDEIFSHASGVRGADTSEPMTMDSVFWIASCTKMILGIAAMQLVEQGKLSLDDSSLVEKLAPELKEVKVLKGFGKDNKPILVEKEKGITLRMLLTHTAGFGYTFFSPELRKFGFPAGIDEFSGRMDDMKQPLLFQPGERFNYGINIDWAGVLVERVTGMSLHDYFIKNIFQPLGIKNISFFPAQEMKDQLASMHQRHPDGHLVTREHPMKAPLYANTPEQQKEIFNSAGAGCFAQPREYVKIIATLLNDGTSPTTKVQILKKETVDLMFANSIPTMPNFGRQPIAAARPEYTNSGTELYPQPHDQEQGWGLTFMITIHPGATGRGKNTGWWAGLPNLFWWCDREKGVGGMVASQILPFGDLQVFGLWAQVEASIYHGGVSGNIGSKL